MSSSKEKLANWSSNLGGSASTYEDWENDLASTKLFRNSYKAKLYYYNSFTQDRFEKECIFC